ncbi:hypothetical protein LCGC14_0813490 [marine sediment metagenome]|uniref:Uncharacterized protein n=1 Tax=marine sediment metagenome TaxID=412755 RepID=A0A0F9Q671_9ZZZZ|nr:MAG: Tetratricopeptide repeat protein [Candidatus Lokiarchaeum sp. GC14_75]HDZ19621.1 tetratricopeptide repeat protein [archaeon]HEC37412.1 tetratricopeptide repeat protein [bacterium]
MEHNVKEITNILEKRGVNVIKEIDLYDRKIVKRESRKLEGVKPKQKRLIETLKPKTAGDYCAIGIQERNLKNHETAVVYFSKALELRNDYIMMWINKGESLRELGRNNEAIECFDQALKLDPTHIYANNLKQKLEGMLKK